MSSPPDHPPAQAFFLDASPGKRFCLYHAPPPSQAYRGAYIYLHPFGEEMNKARRMAALQARAMAAKGFAVLQIDLYGCGDSSGDFSEARWEIWQQDLAAAYAWLQQQTATPISLWGLRLGALLALDFACNPRISIQNLMLWQPVLRGELYLTQFLRLKLAADALGGQTKTGTGTSALRSALSAGESVEIAGYELAPAMAASIDALDAARITPPSSTIVHWFECMTEPDRPLSAAANRVAAIWKQKNVDLHMHPVPCPPFWLTQERVECPALLAAVEAIFDRADS